MTGLDAFVGEGDGLLIRRSGGAWIASLSRAAEGFVGEGRGATSSEAIDGLVADVAARAAKPETPAGRAPGAAPSIEKARKRSGANPPDATSEPAPPDDVDGLP